MTNGPWNYYAITFELDTLFSGSFKEICRYLEALTSEHSSCQWVRDESGYESMTDPRFPVQWQRQISGGEIIARHLPIESTGDFYRSLE